MLFSTETVFIDLSRQLPTRHYIFQALIPTIIVGVVPNTHLIMISTTQPPSVWKFQVRREGNSFAHGSDSLSEASLRLSEWKWRKRRSGLWQSDVVHIRNDPHLNPQSNVTGTKNSYVATGSVFGNLYEKRHFQLYVEKPHQVFPSHSSSHCCTKNCICLWQQRQAAPAGE